MNLLAVAFAMRPIVFGFWATDRDDVDLLTVFSFSKPYTNHSSSLSSRTERKMKLELIFRWLIEEASQLGSAAIELQ